MDLRLILMRHGKAERDSDDGTDHSRALKDRGRREAAAVGALLATGPWRPTLIITSDARRARETADLVADALTGSGPSPQPILNAALYHTGLPEIAKAVTKLVDSSHSCVLIAGHNPGFSDAVSELCGTPTELATADAALVKIDAPSWAEAFELTGTWELVDILGA